MPGVGDNVSDGQNKQGPCLVTRPTYSNATDILNQ